MIQGVKFSNKVVLVNSTPHPVSIQDTNGELVTVPCSVLINARAVETQVSDLFVKTSFVGDEAGTQTIAAIEDWFANEPEFEDCRLVILGSIIAAQTYPGKVFGMTPVPGYERVAPAEKRMRCDKFTTFAE